MTAELTKNGIKDRLNQPGYCFTIVFKHMLLKCMTEADYSDKHFVVDFFKGYVGKVTLRTHLDTLTNQNEMSAIKPA